MKPLLIYLETLKGKIFKLLPMMEDTLNGVDNHLHDFLDNLISNSSGALEQFPQLQEKKDYIEVCNNLYFIKNNEVSFQKWRTIILRSTRLIHNLHKELIDEQSRGD